MHRVSDLMADPEGLPAEDGLAVRRTILGVAMAPMSHDVALDLLARAAKTEAGFTRVAFANAHTLNLAAQSTAYRDVLNGFVVLPDGIGVDLASHILHGRRFPANLNGTDVTPALLARMPSARVGLVGARPGVAVRAAERLRREHPQHEIVVLGDGFFDVAGEAAILGALKASPVDVLLVAFGNPRQEQWIADKIDARHARLAMGVGALFDFWAGEVARAPSWVRSLRAEWVWRLALEPGRLWRRYVLGNPLFLARVLAERIWRR